MSTTTGPVRERKAVEEALPEVSSAEIVHQLRDITGKLANSYMTWHRGVRWPKVFWVFYGLLSLCGISSAFYGLSRATEPSGWIHWFALGFAALCLLVFGVWAGAWLAWFLFPELLLVRSLLKVRHRRLGDLIPLASRLREHRDVTGDEKVALDSALAEADTVWDLAGKTLAATLTGFFVDSAQSPPPE